MPSSEGVEARKAALRMLDAVLRRGLTMDDAARSAQALPDADRALATAIAGETIRRLPEFDRLIDGATRQRLPDDSKARMVLRMALAQKVGLGTPDHALVATALPLVDGGPRRLVHGVLGTLLRGTMPTLDSPHLPDPVERRWQAAWGDDVVAAARRTIVQRPPLDLSFADPAGWEGFAQGLSLAALHRRIPARGPVTALPGFDQGQWWVQDLAASLPARLVPTDAKAVLDVCSAPGGKTMQLAAAGYQVTALDRSESRLGRLSDNLRRTGLAAQTCVADAFKWVPDQPFDAILLDAPCSATGTFRRNPEVLYRASPALIAQAAERQAMLLDRAADWTRPGGSLIYSVCSLEQEEGEAQVERLLQRRSDFRIVAPPPLAEGVAAGPRGWVRTLPGMLEEQGGIDGFFAVHLVRAAA